jgi:hypothetical protein
MLRSTTDGGATLVMGEKAGKACVALGATDTGGAFSLWDKDGRTTLSQP